MFFHPADLLLIPTMLFALWAQYKVKSAYAKYAEVGVQAGITGADVARMILQDHGIQVVEDPNQYQQGTACGLQPIPGELSDHYDPRNRMLGLSQDVYYGRSISALGIAAHEVGHAIQHARMYAPMELRSFVYPVCSLGSTLAFPLFLIGMFAHIPILLHVAIFFFAGAVFFTFVTLPVEFDASRRALASLEKGGYLLPDELRGARKVLSAAAMTYVASAATAAVELIRMLLIARSRD